MIEVEDRNVKTREQAQDLEHLFLLFDNPVKAAADMTADICQSCQIA